MIRDEFYEKISHGSNYAKEFPILSQFATPVKYMTRQLVGRDKQLLQLRAGLMRPELCNVLLLGEPGSGKALANGTEIPVNDERCYVPIEELQEGDFVFDEQGEPVEVTGVFPQGKKQAYKLVFEDGSEIICCDEHLWNVRTKDDIAEDKPYRTMTLGEMLESETDISDYYIPCNQPVRRGTANVNKLGYHGKNDDGTEADMNTVIYDVYGHMLAEGNCSSDGIPDLYMSGSYEQRRALMMAFLIDKANAGDVVKTDVSENKSRRLMTYCMGSNMKNDNMLESIVELFRSLGHRCRLHVLYGIKTDKLADDYEEGTPSYTEVSETEEDGKEPFYALSVHFEIMKDMQILSAEKLNKQEMTCIYVAGESHLFQAGRAYLVTHNTALVQGAMAQDPSSIYLELDIARMIGAMDDAKTEMPAQIKQVFDEAARFVQQSRYPLVLFIDEFHQIISVSEAAVEALKPMLADSGTRGIKVIVATTFMEFRKYVSENHALVERLQRIEMIPPDSETTVQILRGFSKVYGVSDFVSDELLAHMVELTDRLIPSDVQPRKSILLLDQMCGWYHLGEKMVEIEKAAGRVIQNPYTMGRRLLYNTLSTSQGIVLGNKIDAVHVKEILDKKVFSQELATQAVAERLQISVADLHEKDRPIASFLFTGSTGVGKAVPDSVMIPVYTKDGSTAYKRNGDLKAGDFVFGQYGQPVEIEAVFPQGELDVYEVELTDGRCLEVSGNHIWLYKSRFGNGSRNWRTATTEELMQKYQNKYYNSGRNAHNIKFVIPMNQAVQWPEQQYAVPPYVLGAAVSSVLQHGVFSTGDKELADRVAGMTGWTSSFDCGFWTFALDEGIVQQIKDVLIPESYCVGSVSQRWELIQGLFDADGVIESNDGYRLSYCSPSGQLATLIQHILYSLGVSSNISCYKREGKHDEYDLHVSCSNQDKELFFCDMEKKASAVQASVADKSKKRLRRYDILGIRDIRRLPEKKSMTCILVHDEDHLYQAGDFIVTHNTELTKQLSKLLFGDDSMRLIRFDMTEYAQPDSIERFRKELTSQVWARPNSVILFDEIEKADPVITRVLMQVLDDGRLIDQNNRPVSFLNSYIVLTTNAGSEVYQTISGYANSGKKDDGEEDSRIMELSPEERQKKIMDDYLNIIRRSILSEGGNKFPPELLGRIDKLCPFMPLNEETQKKILKGRMKKIHDEVLKKYNVEIEYEEDRVLQYILHDKLTTDSNAGGARIVKRVFEDTVLYAIASALNIADAKNSMPPKMVVRIEGKMAAEDKLSRESFARVKIYGVIRGREYLIA